MLFKVKCGIRANPRVTFPEQFKQFLFEPMFDIYYYLRLWPFVVTLKHSITGIYSPKSETHFYMKFNRQAGEKSIGRLS